MKNVIQIVCLAVLAVIGTAAYGGAPSFQGLSDMPGGKYHSIAYAVSPDGTVAVGCGYPHSDDPQAFMWSRETGIVGLGLMDGASSSEAYDVSNGGEVIVGRAWGADYEAFKWTADTGMVSMKPDLRDKPYSSAEGVSPDGKYIVGSYGYSHSSSAFMWVEGQGLDNPYAMRWAYDVTPDGSHVAGNKSCGPGVCYEAGRWSAASDETEYFGDFPEYDYNNTWTKAISADGATVVGYSNHGTDKGFKWTPAGGLEAIPDFRSANDCSADGRVIVGKGLSGALIWDPVNGTRDLRDVLVNECGLDLTDWTLTEATGISHDGMVIVGYGNDPWNKTEAWIAVIPEPGTITLFGLGGLCLLRKRRAARNSAIRSS